MTVTIVDHQLQYDSHNLYDITFFDTEIRTIVTDTPSYVDTWISDIQRIHWRRLNHLIVGLDVEWRPNFQRNQDNRVATLQLCVGRQCLIFQILHAPYIPTSLENFLGNSDYTFVGLGIESDVEKLLEDYELSVANTVDLRSVAAENYGMRELNNAGLKELARVVLDKEINKPRNITMSRWDNQFLTPAQVKYACVDAYLSFEIGRSLNVA